MRCGVNVTGQDKFDILLCRFGGGGFFMTTIDDIGYNCSENNYGGYHVGDIAGDMLKLCKIVVEEATSIVAKDPKMVAHRMPPAAL